MDKKQWKRAQEIYHAARELRITDRQQFLDYQCEGDTETRDLVERLLKSTDTSPYLADEFDRTGR